MAGRTPGVVLTVLFAISPTPAEAQVGAVVSIFSDDRFRGISLSDGRPVGILDLSYDAPGGLYGAVSSSVVDTRGEGLKALGLVLNGGYATHFRSGLSADVGIVHSRYSHYSGVASGRAYTEVYAGLAGKLVGARLSISPNFLGAPRWTLHGEINGHIDLSTRLLLDGEIGFLVPLGSGGYQGGSRPRLDARVGIARQLGPVTLHATVTSHSGDADIYAGRGHGRTAVIVGISTVL
ncbi:MAG: TorF family putative porin [Sphingomicrobium sp.]